MLSRRQMKPMNRYSKCIKTIRNRIVAVEFHWSQVDPQQSYRLQLNEKQFYEAQKSIRPKKLLNLQFEKFVDLVTPLFAYDTIEISSFVLRSTFDYLFDHNSNGSIEPPEFEPAFILLHGNHSDKLNLFHENLRRIFTNRSNHVSFKEFSEFVKYGYLRELFMS
ncbi:hypothetical protein I4U23_026152 [Adineta vaga]|nr:hypothetical protein I4U23_026152 [Adineta vaga]